MSWLRDKSRTIRIPVVKHDMTMRYFKARDKLYKQGINTPPLRQIFDNVPEKDQAIGFKKWAEVIIAWHNTQTSSIHDSPELDDGEGSSLLSRIESKNYSSFLPSPTLSTTDTIDIYAKYPELKRIGDVLSRHPVFKKDERSVLQKGSYASAVRTTPVFHFNKENFK